jgi:hypothetical protein
MPNAVCCTVRKAKNKKAILFIHGFLGEAHHRFGI